MATVRYTTINGRVIAEKRSGVRKLYRPDHLGSTIAMYDNTQAKTDTWVYWPYGAVRTRTGTTATPFQFVGVLGYCRDAADRTYVRARFYRQTLGIWQTRDPLWPKQPGFSYARCSPATRRDPTGLREFARPSPQVEIFPRDDLVFKYGFYCGSKNVRPCFQPKPIDCMDAACQTHDDCLDTTGYWDWEAAKCHCALADAALSCLLVGCKLNPNPWYLFECERAATLIRKTFEAICAASTVTGIGGLIWGWISEWQGSGIDHYPLEGPGEYWDPGSVHWTPGGSVEGRPGSNPIMR